MSKLIKEYVSQVLSEDSQSFIPASCRYETSVIRSLKQAGATGYIKRAACSDPFRPDSDIKVDGQTYYVELKSNGRAQMGGGSIGYSISDKMFYPVGKNRDLSETLANLLNDINDSSLHRAFKAFVTFLEKKSKSKIDGFPTTNFSPDVWDSAVKLGLLQPINRTLEGDVDVIVSHYARKETHYIQIGGQGLFSLGDENPAGLPIPKLKGKVQLEVRVAKGGSGGAGIRVQARLLANNMSPFTLDDPDSVKQLLRIKRTM